MIEDNSKWMEDRIEKIAELDEINQIEMEIQKEIDNSLEEDARIQDDLDMAF